MSNFRCVATATAKGLLQLAQSRPNLDKEELGQLDTLGDFLITSSTLLAIGRPGLQSHLAGIQTIGIPQDHGCRLNPPRTMVEPLRACILAEDLFTNQESQSSPWDDSSRFRPLQRDIDTLIVRGVQSATNQAGLPQSDSCDTKPSDAVFLLMCHCAMVTLNRSFLPIPVRITGPAPKPGSSTINWAQFPDAPKLFLKERIARCDASAAAICALCRELITKDQLFSVFRRSHSPSCDK